MGIDDIPLGPDMFERWIGPYWGIRVWRAFFGIIVFGVSGGILFGGWKAYEEIIRAESTTNVVSYVTSASIQWHIYGDTRVPKSISETNVWRWYYVPLFLQEMNKKTGSIKQSSMGEIMFLTFDRPVIAGTLEVTSPDVRLPPFDIKDFTQRSAVISFNGPIPEGTLNIYAH